MTKLLVSVRSAAEAQIACESGVDLIDVKEPARGSLGAADPATMDAIVRQVAGRRPLSVALGELTEPAALSAAFAGRVKFAKFGLAGGAALPNWQESWQARDRTTAQGSRSGGRGLCRLAVRPSAPIRARCWPPPNVPGAPPCWWTRTTSRAGPSPSGSAGTSCEISSRPFNGAACSAWWRAA